MLTTILPARFQPYAKAVLPALATIVGVFTSWLANGELDRVSLAVAITGAIVSLLTLLVENTPANAYAKTIAAALGSIIGVFVTAAVVGGALDRATLASGVTALVSILLVYSQPNRTPS